MDQQLASTQLVGAREPDSLAAASHRRTALQNFWRSFRRYPAALAGLVLLLALIITAVIGPGFAPYAPDELSMTALMAPPSRHHLLGTDQYGRDVLSRLLSGAHLSLSIGLISVGIGLSIGGLMGLAAGYWGHWVDSIIMRLIDIQLAIPGILLAMGIVAVLGASLENVMIAVGISSIPTYARVMRGTVLSAKELTYVEAAHSLGCPNYQIIARHILPNTLAPVIVLATLGVPSAILLASGLSFIGLGAQPPTPEWGAMLNDGHQYLAKAWWLTTFPGLAIMIAVLAINMVGDGLRDALDPRLRTDR